MYKEFYRRDYGGVAVGRIKRNQNFTKSLGFYHNEYQIQYIFDGERYFFTDGRCFRMVSGTMAVIDKTKIAKTNIIGGSHHDRLLIEIKESEMAPLCALMGVDFGEFFVNHHGVYQIGDNRFMQNIISEIEALAQENEVEHASGKIMLCLLNMVLGHGKWENCRIRKFDKNSLQSHVEKQKKVHQVADYITENYERIDSVTALADKFFMSKSYLCRIFKEVTNFTISEYINLYRIAASKQYLKNEDMTMAEIANRLGYDSLTYFERVFKKQMKVTPLQYRKYVLKVQ